MAASAIASVMSRLKQARIHRSASRSPPVQRRLAGADWRAISSGWGCVQVAGEVSGEASGGGTGACGAAAGALSAAGADADGLAAASRKLGSATRGRSKRLSMGLSLNGDREQAEDDHVKAELGDRRMAEQLLETAQTQDRSQSEKDGERHHRIGHERRDEDAAEDQLGKCVHHDRAPTVSAPERFAASMTIAATASSLLTSSASALSAPALFFSATDTPRRRCVSS